MSLRSVDDVEDGEKIGAGLEGGKIELIPSTARLAMLLMSVDDLEDEEEDGGGLEGGKIELTPSTAACTDCAVSDSEGD